MNYVLSAGILLFLNSSFIIQLFIIKSRLSFTKKSSSLEAEDTIRDMKKMLLLLFCGLSLTTVAQQKKGTSISKSISDDNGKLHFQVEKEENGKKTTFDKTYDVANLSEKEKQALIDRVSDSLGVNNGNETRRMKIKIHSSDDFDKDHQAMRKDMAPPMPPRMKKDDAELEKQYGYKFDIDIDKGMDQLGKEFKNFEFNMDEPVRIIRRFGNKMPSFAFNESNESKTIQTLRAYPNNPFNNRLNVKFEAPEKGDVTITVTDITGKEVGRDVIKDFSGEYVGQVELKKAEKGTYFVTVVQGKDGTVRRVVVE